MYWKRSAKNAKYIRWGSDHVVLFDDETKEMAKGIVRCDALGGVYMALDYCDASSTTHLFHFLLFFLCELC